MSKTSNQFSSRGGAFVACPNCKAKHPAKVSTVYDRNRKTAIEAYRCNSCGYAMLHNRTMTAAELEAETERVRREEETRKAAEAERARREEDERIRFEAARRDNAMMHRAASWLNR